MALESTAVRRAPKAVRRFNRVPLLVITTIIALIGGLTVWPLIAASAPTPYPVFDVNHAGVFQLDGETHQQVATTPTSYNWEQLFTSSGALVSTPPSNLLAGAMFLDPASNDFAFTTGGSKDVYDTSSWKCAVANVDNKDELTFASAALFTAPSGTPLAGHEMFYMNLNRGVSTNGTSNAGFWLFKKPTVCNPATGTFTAPGSTTTQTHSNGDVFLFASFTIGGTAVTINTYQWENGALQLVSSPGASGQACYDTPSANLCGVDNNGTTLTSTQLGNCTPSGCNGATTLPGAFSSPWGNTLTNGFFEAGADLTAIEQAAGNSTVPCFASFEADTRSSGSSVSAQLKDFAGGAFNPCKVSTVSHPANPSGIVLGGSTSDSATVTQSPASAPAPTGNVTFYACRIGPAGTVPAPTGNCVDTNGVPLSTDANLGSQALPAAAPFTVSSNSYTPNQTGEYCFVAVYPGDNNYTTGSTDSSSGECFPVTPAPTNTVTTPSAGVTSPITLGGSVTDSAVISANPPLSGVTNPPPIGGTISYAVCGPLQTTSTSGPNCTPTSNGYMTLGSATVTNGVGGQSSLFTPHAVGTYCFVGTYSGDSNYQGSSDSSSGECITVGPAPTQTVTTPSVTSPITLGASVADSAVVSPNPSLAIPPFPAVDGTVSFYVCGPFLATDSGLCVDSSGNPLSTDTPLGTFAVGAGGSAGPSSSYTPKAAGFYCFLGIYSPGPSGNYLGSSDNSSTECFKANPAPAVLGSTVALDDTVSIQKNATAGQPAGDVTFDLYGPFTSQGAVACTAANIVPGSEKTITVTNETYDSGGNGDWTVNEDIPATGSGSVWYAWGASFASNNAGGNTNYANGSLGCSAEEVNLNYAPGSGFVPPANVTF
jgi:hypothetical protein